MLHRISTLFSQHQIEGPQAREFDRVAVAAEQSGPAALYLVIEQEYLNTSQHITQALNQGCRLFVGEGSRPAELVGTDATWVSVESSLDALWKLASRFRDSSQARRIAVTGSTGKTTTKDMITHLLRSRYYQTIKTFRNYNGELGIPLTLRKLRPENEFVVVEVGMRDAGSMQPRSELVKPHVAVVTNVGLSHVARLGSQEAIAREKAALVQALVPGGLAVLNGDDTFCRSFSALAKGPVVFYGLGASHDVAATDVTQGADGLRFRLHHVGESVACTLPLLGTYQIYNALAATAVALWAGISLAEIAARFVSFKPTQQHGRVFQLGETVIVDDAYNSGPDSLRAVLASLTNWSSEVERWLVLGDMQPLEGFASRYYAELAQLIEQACPAGVIFIGEEVRQTYEALPPSRHYFWAEDEAAVVELLRHHMPRRSLLWLKGQDDRLFARITRHLKIIWEV